MVKGRRKTYCAGSQNIVSRICRGLALSVISFCLSPSKPVAELGINPAASLEADRQESMGVTLHSALKISLSSESHTLKTERWIFDVGTELSHTKTATVRIQKPAERVELKFGC